MFKFDDSKFGSRTPPRSSYANDWGLSSPPPPADGDGRADGGEGVAAAGDELVQSVGKFKSRQDRLQRVFQGWERTAEEKARQEVSEAAFKAHKRAFEIVDSLLGLLIGVVVPIKRKRGVAVRSQFPREPIRVPGIHSTERYERFSRRCSKSQALYTTDLGCSRISEAGS